MGILSTLSVLAALFYLGLAVLTLGRGLSERLHRSFFVLTLSLAAFSFTQAMSYEAPDAWTAWIWFVSGSACWILAVPGQLLVVIHLTRRPGPPCSWRCALLYLPILPVVAAGVLAGPAGESAMVRTAGGWTRDLSSLSGIAVAMAVVVFSYLFASLVLLVLWLRTVRSQRQIRQARWLAWTGVGSLLLVVGFLSVNSLLDVPRLPRVPQLFVACWALGYAVAIFRYRLMAPSPALAANAILDAIQDLVFLVDLRGVILLANPRALPLLGIPAGDLVGRPLRNVLREPTILDGMVEGPPETLRPSPWREAALVTREGTEIPVLMAASPVLAQDGDCVGLVVVAQDQRPFREAIKNERMQSIGLLAGGLAHDFNNLLTAIGGYVALASTDLPEDSDGRRRLDEATKACQRAQGLTRQLLTFSRGGAPIRTATSLRDLLQETASFVTSGSGVQVVLDATDDLWAIDADEGQIAQVVHNLALNAVQAMPDGGRLHLSARNVPAGSPSLDGGQVQADAVLLTVRDEGQGIPSEHLDRVFDPFFTTKVNGTGLGLATVDSIVRRHGGTIRIESAPGKGTTFRVQLPRARRITGPVPIPLVRPGSGKGRLLVMDDQPSVLQVAREMLASLGYDTEGCSDGETAVGLHHAAVESGCPFDVVLLDLTVPGGMGGGEALHRMRALDPGVRAIVSSGYSEDAGMADHRRLGFDGALPKPYTIEQLGRAIERARLPHGAAPGTVPETVTGP